MYERKETIQCKVCKRIKDNGEFRLPWPGELGTDIKEVYCKRCAQETLKLIQHGVFARHSILVQERRSNRKASL